MREYNRQKVATEDTWIENQGEFLMGEFYFFFVCEKSLLEYFGITRGMFNGGESRGWRESRPLNPHSFQFPLFRLGELSGYDDQAQVDHEKWSNLIHKEKR